MSNCVEWSGKRDSHGYGRVYWHHKNMLVHRLVWYLANGSFQKEMSIRHKCDNPACYNLDHLEIGTHAENMKDMSDRGRVHIPAKLTIKQVAEIKDIDFSVRGSMTAAAKEYGVSISTIHNIAHGNTWSKNL